MRLIENATEKKLRGAYYTPPPIASFILKWGTSGIANADILEPSCGDGVFLEQLGKEHLAFGKITAVEIEPGEANKARSSGLRNAMVINADFHHFCLNTDQRFDLVVGNPPFIRYQYYPQEQQRLATEIFKIAGLKRSKLTNAWMTFVVGSCLLLRKQGKLGFVVPAELLQVSCARQLRQHLARFFNKIHIVSFENLVFKDIQQEIVLLLCEKNGTGSHLIEHIEVKDADALCALNPLHLNLPTKQIDFHDDKWNYYFLNDAEIDFLRRIHTPDMPKIGDYAEVEVGITTGSNGYFTVPQSTVSLYQLQDYARPMVGRSVQVNSICFTHGDWCSNRNSNARASLLVFPPKTATEGGDGAKAYIEDGVKRGINKGYKTSIRDDWYVIPSIRLSNALFLRRNNLYPKFVLNEAHAYTTDTMHRVFIRSGVHHKALIASYYNSLSFAFAEIAGRNFGGGVLELMPSEVEEIYLPYREENAAIFSQLDSMVREHRSADEILDMADDFILRQGMGFSKNDMAIARSIWHKLMGRRLNRQPAGKESSASVQEPDGAISVPGILPGGLATPYGNHGKPQQLRLAIEKRKRHRAAESGKATESNAKRTPGTAKQKRPKAVKARYAKHG